MENIRKDEVLRGDVKKQMAAHRRNVQAMVIDKETQTSLLNIGNTRDTAEENTRQREYQREPITRDQHLQLSNLLRTNHVTGTTMTVPQTSEQSRLSKIRVN
jgi:hypothetical protein